MNGIDGIGKKNHRRNPILQILSILSKPPSHDPIDSIRARRLALRLRASA
jgi:hypothetical protein